MSLMTQVGLEFIARNKANRQMLAFGNSIRRIRYRLRGLAAGLLGVAGVAGFGYMIKRQMETIDATAKLSDRLGIATERLVGLQHAAELTGTDAATLNKSLEIFVRRLGEMTQGSGEAKRGLDMLGLTAELLINKSPAEAFGIAADRIKLLKTQAEKTAAAYYLLGRSGSQMLNMLESGSKGLKDFQIEAERLGLTFSRFDASQIEAANDALTWARATMTGLFRQATIQLAPYIETLANRFTEFATAGEGLGANVTNAFESMSIGAIKFGESLNELPATLSSIKAGMYDVASFWDKFAPGQLSRQYLRIIKGQKAPSEIAAELRARAEEQKRIAATQITATQKFFSDLRIQAEKRRAELEARAPGVGVGPLTAPPEAAPTIDIAAAQRAMFNQMRRMTMAHYKFRLKTIEDLKQKYIDSGLARVEVDQWYVEQALKLDIQRLRSSNNLVDGFRAAGQQIQLEIKTWGEIGFESAMTMQKGFGSAFADMLMRIETVNDAFRSLAMSVARVALTRMGENIYGTLLSGLLRGGATATGAGLGGEHLGGGGLAGTGYGGGYQHGGWAMQPQIARLAEREPELVIPLSKFGKGGGGNIVINISNNGLPLSIDRVEQRYQEDQRIIDVFTDNIERGGAARRVVQEIIANSD